MARTKQTARKSEGPFTASRPMNAGSMRIAPYIQKSKPQKTKKPKKIKKPKTSEAGGVGTTAKTEDKTAVDLRMRCNSAEECKCRFSCFAVWSSESEEDSDDDEDSGFEDPGSACEDGSASEEANKCEDKDVKD